MAEQNKTRARLEELRATSNEDLTAVEAAARKRIYQFRKDALSKPQEDKKVVKNSRKEIARVLTIKRQRELSGE